MIPDRDKRIAKSIYKLFNNVISKEIGNWKIRDNVFVTKVEITKDLSLAKIFIHIKSQDENRNRKFLRQSKKQRHFSEKKLLRLST